MGAIAVFNATYMIALYLIYLPQSWHSDGYFIELSTCGLVLNEDGVPLIAQYFGIVSLVLELFLPSLITFTCFVVVSVTRFLMTWPVLGNEEDRKFHRASVTRCGMVLQSSEYYQDNSKPALTDSISTQDF